MNDPTNPIDIEERYFQQAKLLFQKKNRLTYERKIYVNKFLRLGTNELITMPYMPLAIPSDFIQFSIPQIIHPNKDQLREIKHFYLKKLKTNDDLIVILKKLEIRIWKYTYKTNDASVQYIEAARCCNRNYQVQLDNAEVIAILKRSNVI